jgi:hypothetical protein
MFLHGLQQGRLSLGWGAVDLVGKNDIGKHRTLDEPEMSSAGGVVFFDDLRAGDVRGHQIGCKLNSAEFQVQRPGEGGDKQRFGQPRYTDQQAVPRRQKRNKQLLDDLILADNDLGNLSSDFLVGGVEVFYRSQISFGINNRHHSSVVGARCYSSIQSATLYPPSQVGHVPMLLFFLICCSRYVGANGRIRLSGERKRLLSTPSHCTSTR